MQFTELVELLNQVSEGGKDPLAEIDKRIDSCQSLIGQLKEARRMVEKMMGKPKPTRSTEPRGQGSESDGDSPKMKIAKYLMENETITSPIAISITQRSPFSVHGYLNSGWFEKAERGVYRLSGIGRTAVEQSQSSP